jgi:acylphosphatase
MTKIGRHCYVTGKVQGVFYRQNAKQQALLRNLTGWVKNLPDGRVEAAIFGEADQVLSMLQWLAVGPDHAVVTDLAVTEIPVEDYMSFDIQT